MLQRSPVVVVARGPLSGEARIFSRRGKLFSRANLGTDADAKQQQQQYRSPLAAPIFNRSFQLSLTLGVCVCVRAHSSDSLRSPSSARESCSLRGQMFAGNTNTQADGDASSPSAHRRDSLCEVSAVLASSPGIGLAAVNHHHNRGRHLLFPRLRSTRDARRGKLLSIRRSQVRWTYH